MQAFLTPDLYDHWLAPKSLTVQKNTAASKENRQELVELLELSSAAVASTITTHLVDRAVNSTRTVNRYDPELIAAIKAGLMILTARVRNTAVPTETRDITETAADYETAADSIFNQVPESGWQILYLRRTD